MSDPISNAQLIALRFAKLRQGVSAFKDKALLHTNCPYVLAGYAEIMMSFTIAEHEDPAELDNRMLGALLEERRILNESIEKLKENIQGI